MKDSVYSVALNADGSRVASGSPDGFVRISDPRTADKGMKLRGHTANIRCITAMASRGAAPPHRATIVCTASATRQDRALTPGSRGVGLAALGPACCHTSLLVCAGHLC